MARSSSLPVVVLTGFLGAGKTSLLNHFLSADHGLRVGVVVNGSMTAVAASTAINGATIHVVRRVCCCS